MDKIIRATAGDGFIKMAVITARDMVECSRTIHHCTPTASAALGRTLCAASLLGEAMKEENASLTTVLDEDGEEELFRQVLKGFSWHTVGEAPVAYRCPCSRERISLALTCLDGAELEEIIADGEDVVVNCQFCDRIYLFTPEELRKIADEK